MADQNQAEFRYHTTRVQPTSSVGFPPLCCTWFDIVLQSALKDLENYFLIKVLSPLNIIKTIIMWVSLS